MLIKAPARPAARAKIVFPDECSLPTLVLPSSAPDDGALVCLRVTNDWSKILLDLASILEDNCLWAEGTDLDLAYIYAQRLEQMIVDAVEDCEMAVIPIGCIMMFATSGLPDKWLVCDGSAVSRTTYALLFTEIGTNYGAGDGTTTFNVPDFRDYSPMGVGTVVMGFGAVQGALQVSLSANQNGAHTHSISDPGHAHRVPKQSATVNAAVNVATPAARTDNPATPHIITDVAFTGATVNPSGLGEAHDNLHPVIGTQFIIYAGET